MVDYSKGKIFSITNIFDRRLPCIPLMYDRLPIIEETVQELKVVLRKFKRDARVRFGVGVDIGKSLDEYEREWLSARTDYSLTLERYFEGYRIQLLEPFPCISKRELRTEMKKVYSNYRNELIKQKRLLFFL